MVEINPVTIADLPPMQADFVRHYVALGGQIGAGEKAALLAGYSASGARVRASEFKRNPRIRACIDEMLERKLKDGVSLAIQVLYDLARDAPPSVKLSAAKELLDRGIGPVASRNAPQRGETVEDLLKILDQENDLIARDEGVLEAKIPFNKTKRISNKDKMKNRLAESAERYKDD